MILRERQQEFVDKNVAALMSHGNTLGVAPTGAGKTICLAAVIGELDNNIKGLKTCVLAHRDELTYQNQEKFSRVNPHITTGLYNANIKSWDSQVTFAMVQTLSRPKNLGTMPHMDLIVIDEAHHVTAQSYQDILNQAREVNPAVKVFGVTATPIRGDKSSLGNVFSNCGDQIQLCALIESGDLVKPVTWIADMPEIAEKLQALKVKATGDYNEKEVADIMDTEPLNSEVVKHWREKAGDRKTVIFCSTVEHAKNVTQVFNDSGIPTIMVTGECSAEKRKKALNAIISGEAQIIVNVAVLTEGWDFPPISCVVLLRSSSYKSTMIQMIGRGLRTIDSAIYPGIVKTDCVVLDFGISSILHGCLEQSINLKSKCAGFKLCRKCKKAIPKATTECPLCGYDLLLAQQKEREAREKEEKRILANLTMSELDLLKRDGFWWTKLDTKNNAMLAAGFNSWCCIFQEDGQWVAVGGDSKSPTETEYNIETSVVCTGGKIEVMKAADRFLYRFEDEKKTGKDAYWRSLPPSEAQVRGLPVAFRSNGSITRGDASNILTYSYKAEAKMRELGYMMSA